VSDQNASYFCNALFIDRPTDGPGDKISTNTRLRSINISDAANNSLLSVAKKKVSERGKRKNV